MGFVAHVRGERSNAIIAQGLQILANLDHRGGVGADPLARRRRRLPDPDPRRSVPRLGGAGAAQPAARRAIMRSRCASCRATRRAARPRSSGSSASSGSRGRCWSAGARCRSTRTGSAARCSPSMPVIRQAIVARGPNVRDQDAFERKLLAIRKQTQNPLESEAPKRDLPGLAEFYIASFSSRTLVYKGMLLAPPCRHLLQGPRRSADRIGAGDGPPAFLDQHLPVLEARPSLSLHRP